MRRIAAVVLPLLAIIFAVVRAELFLVRSDEWTFRVAGYDPRDLLHGHYVQFRIEVEPTEPAIDECDTSDDSCCYCLERGGEDEPAIVRMATCPMARTICSAFVEVAALEGLTRWYIPEEGADELDRALRDAAQEDRAYAVVAIDGDGQARVRELQVR